MPTVALLLAQCAAPLEQCDLPRTLPWYFGLAIAAAWFATIAGIVLLFRRRWAARRAERRGQRTGDTRKRLEAGKGTDVEPW